MRRRIHEEGIYRSGHLVKVCVKPDPASEIVEH